MKWMKVKIKAKYEAYKIVDVPAGYSERVLDEMVDEFCDELECNFPADENWDYNESEWEIEDD